MYTGCKKKYKSIVITNEYRIFKLCDNKKSAKLL